MKLSMGDVMICAAADDSPYYGALFGKARADALRALKHGRLPPELRAWHTPSTGSARHLRDDDKIDWMGLS